MAHQRCTCSPFLYIANNAVSSVPTAGTIPLGSMVHQMCDRCRLNGDGILLASEGVYVVSALVTLSPSSTTGTAAELSAALFQDGVEVPGARSRIDSTGAVTLSIPMAFVRNDTSLASTVTLVNTGADASVSSVAASAIPYR